MGLSYILKRVIRINYSQMREKLKELHKKSNKSYIKLLLDIGVCAVRYQAGYMDYALFEMYNLSRAQRKTVVTRGINNSFIKRFNDPAYNEIFDNKVRFAEYFTPFMKRELLDMNGARLDELVRFMQKHPVFIAKPVSGMCGKGIEKLNAANFDVEILYKYLEDKKLLLLEECIEQHHKLQGLCPYSVNTCRVITLNNKGRVSVVTAYLRIGNGSHVDNFNSGGMVVPINEKTGIIEHPAVDKTGRKFYAHPKTDVNIIGLKIPLWDKVTEIVREAAQVIPQVGLVGWDVAVCDTDVMLVEGNNFPGHDIYGLPAHRKNGMGILPKFKEAMKNS